MPGQTNNQTLLAAENQEVVALNDIEQAIINLSNPVVTVDLSGLTLAISNLGQTLANALENLNMNITQTNNCGCCGSGGTSTPVVINICPVDPGSGIPGAGGPGDPPGDGQAPPVGDEQQLASRRCKMATFLVDDYLTGVLQQADIRGVDVLINGAVTSVGPIATTVIASIASLVISAALGLVLTPGPTPDDIFTGIFITAVGSIVTYLIATGGQVDFGDLVEFLQVNRVSLICALNSAQYAAGAQSAFLSVVDGISPSLSGGNRAFLQRLMSLPVLVLLFYADKKYQVLEQWIAEQPDDCPCADDTPIETNPTVVYKCHAANYIFDSFTDTVTNFNGFSSMSWYNVASFISALGSGLLRSNFAGIFGLLSGVLTAIIPPLISYLGQLYWRGPGFFTPFAAIANQFIANRDAIICELYEATTVIQAQTALENHITDYVGSVMTANPEYADEQETYISAVKALLPVTVFNELFKTGTEERPEISGYEPQGYFDCSCGSGGGGCNYVKDPNDQEIFGTYEDLPLLITTKVGGLGRQWIFAVINADDYENTCGAPVNGFTIANADSVELDTSEEIQGYPLVIYGENQTIIYEGNTFPPGALNGVRGIGLRSFTPGHIVINYL